MSTFESEESLGSAVSLSVLSFSFRDFFERLCDFDDLWSSSSDFLLFKIYVGIKPFKWIKKIQVIPSPMLVVPWSWPRSIPGPRSVPRLVSRSIPRSVPRVSPPTTSATLIVTIPMRGSSTPIRARWWASPVIIPASRRIIANLFSRRNFNPLINRGVTVRVLPASIRVFTRIRVTRSHGMWGFTRRWASYTFFRRLVFEILRLDCTLNINLKYRVSKSTQWETTYAGFSQVGPILGGPGCIIWPGIEGLLRGLKWGGAPKLKCGGLFSINSIVMLWIY